MVEIMAYCEHCNIDISLFVKDEEYDAFKVGDWLDGECPECGRVVERKLSDKDLALQWPQRG